MNNTWMLLCTPLSYSHTKCTNYTRSTNDTPLLHNLTLKSLHCRACVHSSDARPGTKMSNLKSSSSFCFVFCFGIVFVCLLFCCCCCRFCCCCCCCCSSAYSRICMAPLYIIDIHTLVYVWLKLCLCVFFSGAFFSPKNCLVEAVKRF